MKKSIFLISLFVSIISLRTQTVEPSLEETVQWIKTQVLAYGKDVKEVAWDENRHALIIYYLDVLQKRETNKGTVYLLEIVEVDNYISNLTTGSIFWKDYEDGVGLEMYAIDGRVGSKKGSGQMYSNNTSGKNGIPDPESAKEEDRPVAKIKFLKSFNKDAQGRFTKAMKRLIYLCGGKIELEKF